MPLDLAMFRRGARGELNKNMRIPKYYHKLNEAEQAEWIKKEKEKVRDYSAKYRAKNPDKAKACAAKWDAKNHDKVKAYAAKWRAENRNKAKAYAAKRYAENHDKAKAYAAKYRAENPDKVKAQAARTTQRKRNQKNAMKFFQMTQALSEIANINTEKK